jgi:hypothetical protein
MIKLISLLARVSDLSHEQFVQRWADGAPASIAKSGLCRRYVQYRLHPDRAWPPGTPQIDLKLDGIEEIWLEGQEGQATEVLARVTTAAYLADLLSRVGAMATYVFDEERLINALPDGATGEGMLKRLVPLVRTRGWSHEQFIEHWVNVHAPLLTKVRPAPQRYCQLYVNAEIPSPSGIVPLDVHIDGFSESWFTDEEEMNAGGSTPEGEALAADNKIYLAQSKRFFFDEIECDVAGK